MHHKRGIWAEKQAHQFLKKRGLKLLTRNFRTRMGEIDLVMEDKDTTLVFVEVRYRTHNYYVCPAQTVNFSKRKRLIRTGLFYLQYVKKQEPFSARFDIIGIEGHGQIQWIKNAFMM